MLYLRSIFDRQKDGSDLKDRSYRKIKKIDPMERNKILQENIIFYSKADRNIKIM